MISSDYKYIDPSEVVNAIADDFGKFISIGEEKDVGEFNLHFLSRIQEGFSTQMHDFNSSNKKD